MGRCNVCYSTILSPRSVLIIINGCPSALPQNVAGYRGPNRVNYPETGHIEIHLKPPDSGGQIFVMVFSILTTRMCMFFSCVLKKPHVRTTPAHTGKPITLTLCFQISCINWWMFYLGLVLYLSLWISLLRRRAMGYDKKVFPVPNWPIIIKIT